jgi:uncharacterized protein
MNHHDNQRWQPIASAFVAAVLFAIGLVISGMTTPSKVVGFLDVFGQWDPSLAFVMVGAIGVHAVLHWLIRKRPSPLFAGVFHIPTKGRIDMRLVLGAVLFGVGWGIAGLCPGPALVVSIAGTLPVAAFLLAAIVGMKLVAWWSQRVDG